jgi:ligand-binding SRPBCC domain-containing protein
MAMHVLRRQTFLPVALHEAWGFFSNPGNLGKITPPDLGLRIRSHDLSGEIHTGMTIKYDVRPIFSIPMTWVSEIVDVQYGQRFVDVQRQGPYAEWRHSHIFEEQPEGVLMTDEVVYKVPGGAVGNWLMHSMVSKRLEKIFDYRSSVIARIFQNT